MSENRLTVRFSDEENRRINAQAQALGMTRADVVRLAVESLFTSNRTAGQLAEMRDQLREEIRQELSNLAEKSRRSTLLLLKVLKAPPEAESALENIFGG